jgi:hypothetical protein
MLDIPCWGPFSEHNPTLAESMYLTIITLANTLVTRNVTVFGFGPLSISIVNGDEVRVRALLSRNCHVLKERNVEKQTVFYLALDFLQPKILRILLEDVSYNFDTQNSDGAHVLVTVARRSGRDCRNGIRHSEPCANCSCTSYFVTLQAYGWQLPLYTLLFSAHILSGSFYACRLLITNAITVYKERFAEMGRKFLTTYEYHQFNSTQGCVLDGHAHSVLERLVQQGLDTSAEYEALQIHRHYTS